MRLDKALAFLKKDLQIATSYRLAFLLQLFGIGFTLALFFFLSRLIDATMNPYLGRYGGDYFSFVLIGVAVSNYLSTGLNAFSGRIRDEQVLGTLEAVLATPTRFSTYLLSSSLWSFLWASFQVLVYLLLGVFFFHLELDNPNFGAATLFLALTVIAFSSLGLLAAAFILVLKRGNPVNWFFTSLSRLLGGVYFPVAILPEWLQHVAKIIPLTYSLEGMRMALLSGQGIASLRGELLALVLFTFFSLVIGVGAVRFAIRRARRDGTLGQY
ncbi:MAG: ABC transporter permease [Candidatus Eisenbacteria bacterium]|nr:ABC transporter permease [Candidatus Eisenbacteria bacterium]